MQQAYSLTNNITSELKQAGHDVEVFPYSIFYAITDDTILILSLAHQHRKPFY